MSQQPQELKRKVVFDEPKEAEPDLELNTQLKFAGDDTFLPETTSNTDAETDLENDLERSLAKPKKGSGWFKGLLVAGAAMVGWQTVDYVVTAYQGGDWLALGWSGITAAIATMGITALGRELFKLRRLKQRQSERDQAQALLDTDGMGQGKAFCTKLAKQSGIHNEHAGYDRWQQSLAATHNDREVIVLYDQMVMSQQDKLARRLVSKYSSEAALMVALSPLAIADMLLVAWRNFRLIEQISVVYGVELGYWSRIRLVKLVLANMALAGASEVVADTGMNMLSMDIAGRVSTRVAQGVGVGLLTARLGLKAMAIMRPLPWQEGTQPKLGEIRRDLLSQLTKKQDES
ncbi:YcjF family protein [Photobacterium sanguinicancri]|uniref:YcjF family protein n=1 Tax=Photobacterium sanguinicancri TaxID=875932 RepID=UPI0021C2EE24|nr:YcjF family protein [Photobacterium sanguinicancri]